MYLSFLDILGFKQILENKHVDNVAKVYEDFLNERYKDLFDDDQIIGQHINIQFFSDSIVIYSNDEDEKALFFIIYTTRFLLMAAFIEGFPLRGAITKGELKILRKDINGIQSSVLIGKPIVDAFNLEKQFDWSGCVVCHACEQDLLNNSMLKGYFEKRRIIQYEPPKKNGIIEQFYVINWVSDQMATRMNNGNINNFFERHSKRIVNWDVRRKIENTANFISSIRSNVRLTLGDMFSQK
jgi:hypothetical protein